MGIGPLLAALTVLTTAEQRCPDERALTERLRLAGVAVRKEDDVRVRFSMEQSRLVAEIEMPEASPRRIEHEGPDCASLADATVALLSVLLDERESAPRPRSQPEAPQPSPAATSMYRLRLEAGALFSSGIVAPLAAGATLGAAWRPFRWGSIGVAAEMWPEREHALGQGRVTVGASSLALAACVGHLWRLVSLEGCASAHAGIYSLSAVGFPVVRSEEHALFGGEVYLRGAMAIAKGFGIFVRAGAWLPLTRLDVTARGAESGFVTTTLGPKGAIGLELNR